MARRKRTKNVQQMIEEIQQLQVLAKEMKTLIDLL